MNVYLIVAKQDDKYMVVDQNRLSEEITTDTMVFVTPMFAYSTIEEIKPQLPGVELNVYQLSEKPPAGGEAVLWKISEHDTTAVSYVLVGIKDSKRVYHSAGSPPFVERLVDASRIRSMGIAVGVQKALQDTASKNPGSYWNIDDLHIEHVLEDLVSVDIRQEPLKIKCNMV